jgi:nanoRNase/pAp phosphatase (c-di-AMP/oligoRNAs hydrolase)
MMVRLPILKLKTTSMIKTWKPILSFLSQDILKGRSVAILFKGVEPNLTRVSMRSKTIDVSKIALSFGGGGHQKAAGCSVNANLEEAKKQILAAVFAALS